MDQSSDNCNHSPTLSPRKKKILISSLMLEIQYLLWLYFISAKRFFASLSEAQKR